MVRTLLWRALALLALGTALIGAVLPGLPTVEFLLLSAWAGGKGWPALERWLLDHPRLGPPIYHWREQRAMSRRAKWMATTSMGVAMLLIGLSALPVWAKLLLPATMAVTLAWLWRRPEPVARTPAE